MGISTFGVTYQDVADHFERQPLSTADQQRITKWITEAAGMVAAPIWELGVEPSDVTAEQPLYLWARGFIIAHCCALWPMYATRQDTDYAKAQRAERDRYEAMIKKYAVGNQGDDFDAKEHLGSFRGGRARSGGGRRGVGGWTSKTRM